MIIRVTNKFISIGGSSTVTDENGNELFRVKGKMKLFSPTRKKTIYDKEGKKLFTVRNKFWKIPFAFHSSLIYDENGDKLGRLKQRMSRANRYVLMGDYFDSIRIGKHEDYRGLTIMKNDVPIAAFVDTSIVRDNYSVDCISEEDINLIVALVIAVDNIRDNNRED